jgi:hypothetical protein
MKNLRSYEINGIDSSLENIPNVIDGYCFKASTDADAVVVYKAVLSALKEAKIPLTENGYLRSHDASEEEGNTYDAFQGWI